ncbi:MAG: hypothetical protein ACRD2X_07790 [Vicinamibacteraceae bacterium]
MEGLRGSAILAISVRSEQIARLIGEDDDASSGSAHVRDGGLHKLTALERPELVGVEEIMAKEILGWHDAEGADRAERPNVPAGERVRSALMDKWQRGAACREMREFCERNIMAAIGSCTGHNHPGCPAPIYLLPRPFP